jgi:hypothetical protein
MPAAAAESLAVIGLVLVEGKQRDGLRKQREEKEMVLTLR